MRLGLLVFLVGSVLGQAFVIVTHTVGAPAALARHVAPLSVPLPVAEAAWFLSRNETVTLVATDGRRFVLDYTLEQLEGLLDPARFFRLNRQLIAQLPAVRRLHPHFGGKLLVELHPAPSEEILVSREKAGALKAWLEG